MKFKFNSTANDDSVNLQESIETTAKQVAIFEKNSEESTINQLNKLLADMKSYELCEVILYYTPHR